jgi:hypothetical protein
MQLKQPPFVPDTFNSPSPAQIYASAQTIFLSRQPQGADLSSPPMHYPDEAYFAAFLWPFGEK